MAHLTRLNRISLNAFYQESNCSLQTWSWNKRGCIGLGFFRGFYAASCQLLGVFNKPGSEDSGEIAIGVLYAHLGIDIG